jgi:alpha-tubulin suppressor-like RCC1 family protein
MMGLTKEGDVYAWGKNEDGKLGLGDLSISPSFLH